MLEHDLLVGVGDGDGGDAPCRHQSLRCRDRRVCCNGLVETMVPLLFAFLVRHYNAAKLCDAASVLRSETVD